MIENDEQYQITHEWILKFEAARVSALQNKSTFDLAISKAINDGLKSEIDRLWGELSEYEYRGRLQCTSCGGSGVNVYDMTCSVCNGNGWVDKETK